MRVLVLDNEAVQALRSPAHRKHRAVLAHLVGMTHRRWRGADCSAIVPTAVRVEAGWNRSDAASAAVNRLRIADHPLDDATADLAAEIKAGLAGVSVADAHLGATVRTLADREVVVLTSDPDDMRRVAGSRTITTVRL